MPMSDTNGASCSNRQDHQVVEDESSLLVWRRQELLKIFPNESSEKIENASQQNDLTSAINYLLDHDGDNDDNMSK
jgi:hypothetical protein